MSRRSAHPPAVPHAERGAALADAWRAKAAELERYAPAAAEAFRVCAMELEAQARSEAEQLLTLREAELRSGYSAEHIRHLVRDKKLCNYGRKGAPRVRAGDLPRKPPRARGSAYDPAADALSLVHRTAS